MPGSAHRIIAIGADTGHQVIMDLPKPVNDLLQSPGLQSKLERTDTPWDDALISALRKPATAVVWIVGIAFAVQIIETKTRDAG